jgi:hypothetical protein
MYWLRATYRRRERALIVALLGCLSGCGESILVAREVNELQPDAAAPSLDAGSLRKQAINAERARRARINDDDNHGADSKRQ